MGTLHDTMTTLWLAYIDFFGVSVLLCFSCGGGVVVCSEYRMYMCMGNNLHFVLVCGLINQFKTAYTFDSHLSKLKG
jgi:hypothetical protein